MRHGHRGLEQKQAVRRIAGFNSAAARGSSDCGEIGRGIVTSKRKLEAAFAGQSAVASAHAAAQFREYWLNVVAEIAAGIVVHACNGNLRLRAVPIYGRCDRNITVVDRVDDTEVVNGRHAFIATGEFRLCGSIASERVIANAFHEQLLSGMRAEECCIGRQKRECRLFCSRTGGTAKQTGDQKGHANPYYVSALWSRISANARYH